MKEKKQIEIKGGDMKVTDTKLAIDFLFLNYPLSTDFDILPMITFINESRKFNAIIINTDNIDNDLLITKLKTRYYL
jgi:hypothetical protein